MKGFMLLIFLLIIVAIAGYFFNSDVKTFVNNQLLYDAGVKSHVVYGYKWKSKDGAWQLTQEPPSDGTLYQKIKVRDDWNVMDAPAAPK